MQQSWTKTVDVSWDSYHLTLCNQRSHLWTHPYPYQNDHSTLTSSGCGIFSACHCIQWLTGVQIPPETVADFALQFGGRGDDGTDRPSLLQAFCREGWTRKFGFDVPLTALCNDVPALLQALRHGNCAAFCNLRTGHIVSLLSARNGTDGCTEVLCADSNSETMDARIAPLVTEVIPGSAVTTTVLNDQGIACGALQTYMLYWCRTDTIKDYNLLYKR